MARTIGPPSLQGDVQNVRRASIISPGLIDELEGRRQWQEDLINQAYQCRFEGKYDDCNPRSSFTVDPHLRNAIRLHAFSDMLLGKLKFPGMEERRKQIHDANESTFNWVYSNPGDGSSPRSAFLDWLESDYPQFWISGLAGSGKSTLVKYLGQHGHTRDSLQTWASPKRLLAASFYFLDSGAALHNSKSELLKSLLHDILFQCPELAPSIFPAEWDAYDMFSIELRDSWSCAELEQAFKRLVAQSASRHKLCFFIDGIDILLGDSKDLVGFLTSLGSSSRDLKMCFSSRPWDFFEEVFGEGPKLVLQELASAGISRWIDLELGRNLLFVALEVQNPGPATQLKGDIVKKASGVFLLAELMMRSLLAGLMYGDRISDLQRRLDTLPGYLEGLLEHILNSLDSLYMEHACRLFQLVHAAIPTPTLLCLYFADEEKPTYYVECETIHLTAEEIASRAETMRRRIKSRCKGLLQFTHCQPSVNPTNSFTDCKVIYLHRAVKNFLQRRDIWEKISAAAGLSFNPNEALFKSCIIQLKLLPPQHLLPDSFWHLIGLALEYFIRAQNRPTAPCTELLDELDQAATMWSLQATSSKETIQQGHWRTVGSSSYHWTSTLTTSWKRIIGGPTASSFLAFAIRCQLCSYVEAKLSNESHAALSALLFTAVDDYHINISSAPSCAWSRPSYRMVELLLAKGADPNQPLELFTSWDRVIEQYPPKVADDQELWDDLIRLFLQHGADPEKAPHLRHLISKRPRPLSQRSLTPQKNPIERLVSHQKDPQTYVSPYKSTSANSILNPTFSSRIPRATQRIHTPINPLPTYISPYPPLDPIQVDTSISALNDGEILIADLSASHPRIIQISTSMTDLSGAINTESAAVRVTKLATPTDTNNSLTSDAVNTAMSVPKVKKAIRFRKRPTSERERDSEMVQKGNGKQELG